jgi:hypothetical protein
MGKKYKYTTAYKGHLYSTNNPETAIRMLALMPCECILTKDLDKDEIKDDLKEGQEDGK